MGDSEPGAGGRVCEGGEATELVASQDRFHMSPCMEEQVTS